MTLGSQNGNGIGTQAVIGISKASRPRDELADSHGLKVLLPDAVAKRVASVLGRASLRCAEPYARAKMVYPRSCTRTTPEKGAAAVCCCTTASIAAWSIAIGPPILIRAHIWTSGTRYRQANSEPLLDTCDHVTRLCPVAPVEKTP